MYVAHRSGLVERDSLDNQVVYCNPSNSVVDDAVVEIVIAPAYLYHVCYVDCYFYGFNSMVSHQW